MHCILKGLPVKTSINWLHVMVEGLTCAKKQMEEVTTSCWWVLVVRSISWNWLSTNAGNLQHFPLVSSWLLHSFDALQPICFWWDETKNQENGWIKDKRAKFMVMEHGTLVNSFIQWRMTICPRYKSKEGTCCQIQNVLWLCPFQVLDCFSEMLSMFDLLRDYHSSI